MNDEIFNISIKVGDRYRCYCPLYNEQMVLQIMAYADNHVMFVITGGPQSISRYGPAAKYKGDFIDVLLKYKCNIFQTLK